MIKPRDFQLDAYEMTRQHGAPGDVSFAKKCMEFGYQIGLKDATKEFSEAITKIDQEKERSALPR